MDDTIKTITEEKTLVETNDEQQVKEPEKAISTPISEPDVVDVDLGFVEKRRFRIAGDYNRMLELNVSDLNIFARLKSGYPKLEKLLKEAQEKISSIPDDMEDKEELIGAMADRLTEIDAKMREIIDYIFDTNASEVCAPSGNMFDPVGGEWRYVRILDKLTALYTNGLHSEFDKIKSNVEKKTSKYTKKK